MAIPPKIKRVGDIARCNSVLGIARSKLELLKGRLKRTGGAVTQGWQRPIHLATGETINLMVSFNTSLIEIIAGPTAISEQFSEEQIKKYIIPRIPLIAVGQHLLYSDPEPFYTYERQLAEIYKTASIIDWPFNANWTEKEPYLVPGDISSQQIKYLPANGITSTLSLLVGADNGVIYRSIIVTRVGIPVNEDDVLSFNYNILNTGITEIPLQNNYLGIHTFAIKYDSTKIPSATASLSVDCETMYIFFHRNEDISLSTPASDNYQIWKLEDGLWILFSESSYLLENLSIPYPYLDRDGNLFGYESNLDVDNPDYAPGTTDTVFIDPVYGYSYETGGGSLSRLPNINASAISGEEKYIKEFIKEDKYFYRDADGELTEQLSGVKSVTISKTLGVFDYYFVPIKYNADNSLYGSYSVTDFETHYAIPLGYVITEPVWVNPFHLGDYDDSLFYFPSQIVQYNGPSGTPNGNDQVILFYDRDEAKIVNGVEYIGEESIYTNTAVWGDPYPYGYIEESYHSLETADVYHAIIQERCDYKITKVVTRSNDNPPVTTEESSNEPTPPKIVAPFVINNATGISSFILVDHNTDIFGEPFVMIGLKYTDHTDDDTLKWKITMNGTDIADKVFAHSIIDPETGRATFQRSLFTKEDFHYIGFLY